MNPQLERGAPPGRMGAVINLVIADDHELFRQGLVALLAGPTDLQVTGHAGDGAQAWSLIERQRPTIALLDMRMPVASGVELAARIVRARLPTRVLLLTMFKDPIAVGLALRAGVAGYALKDDGLAPLLAGIRTVAAGGRWTSAAIGAVTQPSTRAPDLDLTEREREVLRWIAGGWSNAQVAAHLGLSVRTIDTHRANAMSKLRIHNTADLVRYAIILGLIDP